jgi:hypothetical protein
MTDGTAEIVDMAGNIADDCIFGVLWWAGCLGKSFNRRGSSSQSTSNSCNNQTFASISLPQLPPFAYCFDACEVLLTQPSFVMMSARR